MKWIGRLRRCANIVPVTTALVALSACGGGSEVETTTVAKALDAAPATVAADGSLMMSLFPAPGAAQSAVDGLAVIGVESLGKKCGQVATPAASNGDVLLSAGGTPTYVVLVEVASSDVEKAKAAGFVVATADYMKSVKEVFDCSTKSL